MELWLASTVLALLSGEEVVELFLPETSCSFWEVTGVAEVAEAAEVAEGAETAEAAEAAEVAETAEVSETAETAEVAEVTGFIEVILYNISRCSMDNSVPGVETVSSFKQHTKLI